MIKNLFVCYVLQIAFTVGIIALFGFLIAICNKRFYMNMGGYGKAVCYLTGAVGTPLHECAHALFCLVFFHKIIEIKLFQLNSADGTLGYVKHTYNPKNIYQKIGNFFIGIAPVLVISAVLYLFAYCLLPEFIADIGGVIENLRLVGDARGLFTAIFDMIRAFFLNADSWQWWVFVFIGTLLSLHMTLSKEDVKGALGGIILLLVSVLVADIILAVIDVSVLLSVTRAVLKFSSYLICVFILALTISVLSVVLSYAFAGLKGKFRIRFKR